MYLLFLDLSQEFQQAFLEGGRWKLYLNGLLISIIVTIGALAIGIVLGTLVAAVRTLHDQERGSRRSPLLFVLDLLCKVYTTVIRGTPMMVHGSLTVNS